MAAKLSPQIDERALSRALSDFERAVGKDAVFTSAVDQASYSDLYAPADSTTHQPSAAVTPRSLEELQAVMRIANEQGVPLWTVSRGKNLGYGGAAPVLSGSVVLDLSRMNRILDVDPRQAACLIEPGVGFYDLYNHLQEQEIPLWMSLPSQAWGSVVGNALDRGAGYTPYGEHASQICGMEVVLPTGEVVRTGAGAMNNSRTWQNFRNGFGPGWDQMFCQSNFGVVSKMGLWLMPAPEAVLTLKYDFQKPEDIIWGVDVLAELRLRRILDSHVTIGTPIRVASLFSQRKEWYDGDGAIPDDIVQKMMEKYNIGFWNFSIRLFGHPAMLRQQAELIKAAFAPHSKQEFVETWWHQGEPVPKFAVHVPTVFFLNVTNWHGGRGGHTDFSPIMPLDGKQIYEQYLRTRQRYDEFGIDFYSGFTLAERYATNVNMVIYDRDNKDMTDRARKLFRALIDDSHRAGYGAYRTHIDYMDAIAQTYDFNNHALLRLNERVKDLLDPNGILSPGKSGIWPRRFREEKR
ncbi:MAG: FAD-binding oxidoreductase [Spongiibacteraceae bacterium]|jgi:4-cresol dehydrogenase (hydroxylating)|nr:FAD-binding oxidoreductase [Spongiibacteraceae bacterium]